MISFSNYLKDVLSQLECNMNVEDQKRYVCFLYTPEQIEKYKDTYFRDCWKQSISAYTALTLFSSYLNDIGHTHSLNIST